MNKEQLAAAAAVMLAASQGAEIQVRFAQPGYPWVTPSGGGENLSWSWHGTEYRVKPKTIKYRLALLRRMGAPEVKYAQVYNEGSCNPTWLEPQPWFVRWLTDWVEVEV